jgi:hypothetical protein
MTLHLTLFGSDYAILISDRRLSNNNKTVTDEHNKATVLEFDDARLVCGFTGIATIGNSKRLNFSTQDWLLDALHETAPPDFLSAPTLQRFKSRCSKAFREHAALKNINRNERKLAFLFAGFNYDSQFAYPTAHPCCAVLTNFRGFAGPNDLPYEPNDFVLREVDMSRETRVGVFGQWQTISSQDIADLNGMLRSNKPANAVLTRAIYLVRRAASKPEAKNTIGQQLNSVILPADRTMPAQCAYHVQTASTTYYQADHAFLTSKQQVMFKRAMIYTSDTRGNHIPDSPPIIVPKVHRNAPCLCVSKIRYRNCHGTWHKAKR